MFRRTDPQVRLFSTESVHSEATRKACEESWAGPFRTRALPILLRMESEFADLFDPDDGRPNRSIALVLGVQLLKEMRDLTDQEALEALRFDRRWSYAFDREAEEIWLCQKTLHNTRVRLMKSDKARLAFRRGTDEMIAALGIQTGRQRLDSTHILSNIAVLTRLGLFCETIRVFLGALSKAYPKRYEAVAEGIRKRYAEESRYRDARKGDGPRRLSVAARDLWRLVERFRGDKKVSRMEAYKCLSRLLSEQCEVSEKAEPPKPDDDDHNEAPAPVSPKAPSEISSGSLQSPHDPAVTYSGHKGKGYEVQVAETCVESNPVQLVTEVEVTRSCESDAVATVPVVKALDASGHKPKELVTDTAYGGGNNAAKLSKMGVTLTCPAPSSSKPEDGKTYPAPPAKCPTTPKQATRWLTAREAQPEFASRYAIRAGSEATNHEFKGAHGMRKLRVRGEARVRLAVFFKALACNLKRALRYWLSLLISPSRGRREVTACRA
jgi:hypothetical protein